MEEVLEEEQTWWQRNRIFIARLASWIIFALIVPVVFILFRFNIFHSEAHIQFGFWGFVVIVIILAFLISTLRYVCKAMPFSMAAQCISGFGKVILPLAVILIAAYAIRNKLDVFIQALWVVITSEAIAIPLNPMPKWIHEHLTEEEQKKINNIMDLALDKYFSRKKDEEK